MSSVTTSSESAHIQEDLNDDERQENIPPGDISTSPKVKEDEIGASSTQTHEENKPLSDTCNFSTPAPKSNSSIKAKSQISGFQSALTPILKCLNIGNKSQSPSKHGTNPSLTLSRFSFGQKSSKDSIQYPNSDFLSIHSGRSVSGINGPVCFLEAESLPEVTLLDVTCDSTIQLTRNDSALPNSAPSTPVTPRCINNSSFPALQPLQNKMVDNFCDEGGATCQTSSLCKNNNTESSLIVNHSSSAGKASSTYMLESTLESQSIKTATSAEAVNTTFQLQKNTSHCTVSFKEKQTETNENTKDRPPVASNAFTSAEVQNPEVLPSELGKPTKNLCPTDSNITLVDHLQSKYVLWGDISLLDVTHDSEQVLSMDVSQRDCLKESRPQSELSRQTVAVSYHADMMQKEELSDKQSEVIKTPLSVTQDITMGSVLESSRSSERSGQNVEKACPANVTCDISTSSNTSAQSAQASYVMECSISSKKAELHVETTTDTVKDNGEEQHTSHDAKLNSTVSPKPQTPESVNISSATVQPPKLCASTGVNTTVALSYPQNRTLDLSTSSINGLKAQSSSVGEASGSTVMVHNNTFDCKPPSKQNGTISLPETSLSHQNIVDKPASPKVCDLTTTLEEEKSESLLSKHDATAPTTEPNANLVETTNGTLEAHPVLEGHDIKDHSDLTMSEALCNTSKYQVMDIENHKANTFNLDDTLDLRGDPLITSTPTCKMFNLIIEQEDDKLSRAQKKTDGDGLSYPTVNVPSDMPSNIICDRKTFLTQPAVKSLWPLPTAPSRLLRFKPASALPTRFDPVLLTSGLPMTRQQAQAKALKDAFTSDSSKGSTGMSSSYSLRATTTGSRQTCSGLRKPQMSGIPTGIQRPAPGLRSPSARTKSASSSSTEKLCGPTAANPPIKPSQAKKHTLTRNENLPVSKRKKTDFPVSSDNTEVSTSDTTKGTKNLKQPATSRKAVPAKTPKDVPKNSVETATSCDPAKGTRALKQPASSQRAGKQQAHEAGVPANTVEGSNSCNAASRTRALKLPANTCQGALQAKQQAGGCAKCIELEEQLRMKSEEIRSLKEELLKYKTQEEDC